MRSVLEVCVDSTASALAAKRGGASRLEPGPQQSTHRQAGLRLDLTHQRKAGRCTAHDQIGTQFQLSLIHI